jgi:hypothetical protein
LVQERMAAKQRKHSRAVTSTTSVESDRESQPEKRENAGPRRGTANPARLWKRLGNKKRHLFGEASFLLPIWHSLNTVRAVEAEFV